MSDEQKKQAVETPGDEMQVRRHKVEQMRESGGQPYAERYEKSHSCEQARGLDDGTSGVRIAGRVVAMRYFGKLAFGHVLDFSGRLQFALQKNKLAQRFADFRNFVDVGDFIGIQGEMMTTRTGEKTIDVKEWTFLSKSLRVRKSR